tara:strand:+ start:22528 stop:23538 length:1011 start_codon:yes stop_codon:yes gene_type:complete
MKTVNKINSALEKILKKDKYSLILGEDLLDPYGGAFKVTQGLSTKYPKQIISTPISEAGFTGIASGMMYSGLNPIVEIMFNDFLTLITDIIINSSSKFSWFSKNKMKGKLLIRVPGGGGRGYGPIHSQNLEKLFFGWPNIDIFATNLIYDPYELLLDVYESKTNVKFFLENKVDYTKDILNKEDLDKQGFKLETIKNDVVDNLIYNSDSIKGSDITFCCYGGSVEKTLNAAKDLFISDEISSLVVVPSKIAPMNKEVLEKIAFYSKKLVIIEEGYADSGWGSYLLTQLTKFENTINVNNVKILGPKFEPIPANFEKEKNHFVTKENIIKEVKAFYE